MPEIISQQEYQRRWKQAHPNYSRDYYRRKTGCVGRVKLTAEERRIKDAKITIANCVMCSREYRKIGRMLSCSVECMKQHRKAGEQAKARKIKACHFPNVYRHSCAQCTKVFVSVNPTYRFCCKRCQVAFHIRKMGERHKLKYVPHPRIPRLPPSKPLKTCKICGVAFDGGRRMLCSEVCSARNMWLLQRRWRRRPENQLKKKREKRELKARQSVARIALAELGIEANGRVAFKALKELGIEI